MAYEKVFLCSSATASRLVVEIEFSRLGFGEFW